jgi:uncharacterized protein YdbL (DUF1318 family)
MLAKMIKAFVVLIALGSFAFPALAMDLDQARASGLLGERADGLVGAVKTSPDVAQLVESINAQRLETYRSLAAQEGTPVDAVQKLAGEKQIAKAHQNGWYWMDAGGAWHKG